MNLDLFSTYALLRAVEQLTPPTTFLRDRYFPTNDNEDIFRAEDVLVEYRDGSRRAAPFVAPRAGGVTMLRSGYAMKRFTPPYIAPRRMLTIDELNKRGFGEALYSQLGPEERQVVLMLKDAEEMDQYISRREEAMAAETLLNNGCIMRHIADDKTLEDDVEIRFYDEAANPARYAPALLWDDPNAHIIEDVAAMARMLTMRGLAASDLVVAPDVADVVLADPKLQKLLDLRNYDIGGVDPALLPEGAARIARLNFKGRMIDILSYDETYEDDDGTIRQFIPSGHIVLTAPACGRTRYGAVSQVEEHDGLFHTYAGKRVPKYLSNPEKNTRSLTMTARPLLMPNNKNPWIAAKVL